MFPAAGGAATTTEDLRDNAFSQKKLKVVQGDTVTWKWTGTNSHNVTVTKGPKKFKSKTMSKGQYSRTLKKPGKYKIVCTLHAGMSMTLVVKKAPPTAVSSTTTTASSTTTTVAR